MKKAYLGLMVASIAFANDSSMDIKNKITLDSRLFYFDRSFDKPNTQNARAFTGGGVLKLQSTVNNFEISAGLYGSFRMITDKDEGRFTSLLQTDGDNIAFIGELYASYLYSKTKFLIGATRLNTPLANDHDLRMLPTTYKVAKIENRDISNLLVEVGYIDSYSGFGSRESGFVDAKNFVGDSGIGYLFLDYKKDGFNHKLQYANNIENAPDVQDYRYLESIYDENRFKIAFQAGGNDYKKSDTSIMYGAIGALKFANVEVAGLYNRIKYANFAVIESGPMYSDWQQGYGNYEPSEAYGGYILFKPIKDFSFKVGAVEVEAKGRSVVDDYRESNLDTIYNFTKNQKLRVRYSIKDQSDNSKREDRDDFRVIYYLSL